jgi:hypothetical protein
MRRAAKRDLTEPAIVAALEKAGARVLRLDVFDLLVLFRGQMFMLDAKTGKGRATFTQEALVKLGWPLRYVRTEIEALKAIGAIS